MKYTKSTTLTCTLLWAIVVATGCDQQQSASGQLDKVQAEATAASRDMKDYTYAQKSAFVEAMQTQLAALNRDVDQLTARIEASSGQVKDEAKPRLKALRSQTDQLNKQLDEVRIATESTWDSVKSGFRKAYDSSEDGFNQARQWVSDKVAP